MRYLVTGKEMKLLDENTSKHFGIPSETLMEQAADGFVRELFSICPVLNKVLVLCGSGNNAGDGVAIARILNQKGYFASIYQCMVKESGLYKKQLDAYRTYNYPETDAIEDEYDLVIDAIFGTGLSRNIEGNVKDIIEKVNSFSCKRIAVDISSGVSADDGKIYGTAFRADDTITFSFEKIGQILYPGAEYCGKVHLVPIGITIESAMDRTIRTTVCDLDDMQYLPKRTAYSNKGTYGKLLLIAGSHNMAGAAYLAARAAYRMGAGLVKIYTTEENRVILQTLIPEAILETYQTTPSEKELVKQLNWADAVVIGPGLGLSESAHKLVEYTLKNVSVPLVIDADGLNIIAEDSNQLLKPHMDIIVTPHLGEMSRLTGEPISYIQSNLLEISREFADKYNLVCHLKDARSVTSIPFGNQWIQLAGNSGMATAGSGDVLAGIIGSLLAQGLSYDKAAYLGAKIHGDCGDLIAGKIGQRALMASDLADGLCQLAYLREI